MRFSGIRFWGLLGLSVLSGCRSEDEASKPRAAPAVPVRYGVELRHLKAADTTVPNGATFATLLGHWGFSAALTRRWWTPRRACSICESFGLAIP